MGQAWGFSRYGGPEVQVLLDRPDPAPRRDEVQIRVEFAGVNPLDHALRSGFLPGLDGGRPFPRALGAEAAGTVVAVGEDVEGFEVGDAVFGMALTGGGTYAVTTVLPASNTARIPAGLSPMVAAVLPVAGTSAVDALDTLGAPAGSTILVNGVGGGVGLAVARLAAGRDLRVIGAGSTAKREHVEALGARFIDYTVEDVAGAARELVPEGFDGIVDLAGGMSMRAVAPLARESRNVISVGDMSVSEIGGRFVERRIDRASLERAARLALDGHLAPVITATYPLADAPAALAAVERGHAVGKVVIQVA